MTKNQKNYNNKGKLIQRKLNKNISIKYKKLKKRDPYFHNDLNVTNKKR